MGALGEEAKAESKSTNKAVSKDSWSTNPDFHMGMGYGYGNGYGYGMGMGMGPWDMVTTADSVTPTTIALPIASIIHMPSPLLLISQRARTTQAMDSAHMPLTACVIHTMAASATTTHMESCL